MNATSTNKKLLLLLCTLFNADLLANEAQVQPFAAEGKLEPLSLQSPINISTKVGGGTTNSDLPDIQFNYPNTLPFKLSFNGHTMQADVDQSSPVKATITLNTDPTNPASTNTVYELKQFHTHSPGEHQIDGSRSTVEWHFVHQSANGDRVVIGVLMDDGAETTPAYRTILDTLKSNLPGEGHHLSDNQPLGQCSLAVRTLIPDDQRCWRYKGSLTSAPYSPVYWCVVRKKTSITESDLNTLFTAMKVNTRPVQNLENRSVIFDTTLGSSTKGQDNSSMKANRSR